METHFNHNQFDRRLIVKNKSPAIKWIKEWVPQDVVATGAKCFLLRWVTEDTLKALNEKERQSEVPEPEPEPTTEVLFLCSYEGCGKTFIDAGALRKHSHIHGERPCICHYEGCGMKFVDSSKLKRHFLIHTGKRDFVCPHKGCGKAFSLDFNLRSHMKTHSQENYHICPYPDCGKRFANKYKLKNHLTSHHEKKFVDSSKLKRHFLIHTGERDFVCPHKGCGKAFSLGFNLRSHMKTHSQEYYPICPHPDCGKRFAHENKLKNHLTSHHEKNVTPEVIKYTPPSEKQTKLSKSSGGAYASASASSDRPYACPYAGCQKAYIHEYKLKLHLRREHPGHLVENNGNVPNNGEHEIEASDQDVYGGKRVNMKNQKQNKPKPNMKLPPSKVSRRKGSTPSPAPMSAVKKPWPVKEEIYEEEDSEETEEDRENVEEGWRYVDNEDDDDDEETEYED